MARALARTAAIVVCLVCLTTTRSSSLVAEPEVTDGPGSVAAGRAHTVVATPDGRVYAWGAGERGQIGDGALIDRWIPTMVSGLEGVVSVVAGDAHSLALTNSGAVYSWGANGAGRLGDGTNTDRPRPVQVALGRVTMIAAGRAHSLALTDEGKVFAWGRNTNGQLGTGRDASSWVPAEVAGLSEIAAIAAGDDHSLAVTRGGQLFAWGSNQFSALGDGTTSDRLSPVAVPLPQVMAIAAGEAHSLALLHSGAVYSWGRGANGELGTGTTEGSATPKQIQQLQASSIAAGRHFSAALRADGRLVAWGANGSGQIGDGTTARRLRPVAVGLVEHVSVFALGDVHAIAVTTSGIVRAWGSGESGRLGNGAMADHTAPIDVATDALDWDGEEEAVPPEPPVLTPASGFYPAAVTVTLTGARASDEIRFTLDGSVPTETSPQYSAPFSIAASTTVTARSFSSSGLSSSSSVETYTIDTIPPAITAATSPELPSTGWKTTPVTVTFHCTDNLGLVSCSEPVTVSEDGRREVTGVAVDVAGHRTALTITVPVDLDPPVLGITAPGDGVQVIADRIEVIGVISDAASGVVNAGCNGQPAAVVDGAVRCEVPLHPGRNEIILHASDAAGHSASAAIAVQRIGSASALTLTPATRTMEVNEVARLTLVNDFGSLVDAAVWTSSDDSVVELSQTDPPELTAIGVGTATITAEKDGIRATASILVAAAFEPGAVRWTIPPLAGFSSQRPIFTNRTDASVPAMFTVETKSRGEATLRAVTAEGEVLWQQHSPGVPLMGDSFGGVLAGVFNEDEDYSAYVRLGGGSIRPWRFESAGGLGKPAQAHDGTLYAIEYLPTGMTVGGTTRLDKYAVVIDGATGRLISRTLLPREVDEFLSELDGQWLTLYPPVQCLTTHDEYAPNTVDPVVGADGKGYLIVRRHITLKRGNCNPPFMLRPDRTIEMALDVMILSPTEPPRTVTVFSMQCAVPHSTTFPCDFPVRAYQLMPDGLGGVLLTFERGTHMVGSAINVQRSFTRIDADGTLVDRPVGRQFWLELVGQAGTTLTYDSGWTAIDVTSGDVKWTSALPNLAVLGVRPDGGLATVDVVTRELKMTDASGAVESTQPFGLDWSAVHQFGDWIGRRGSELAAIVGTFSDASRFTALDLHTGQQRERRPGKGILAKTHLAFPTPLDFVRYRHVSIRVVPTHPDAWTRRGVPMPGVDEFGNQFFTIGAGIDGADTSARCEGTLKSDLNRTNDVGTPPWDPLEKLPYSHASEESFIQALLDRNAAYPDDLPYACRPEANPGFYNSNSYAHGLLNAVGLSKPRLPSRVPALVPGWLTPVPHSKFQ